MMNRNLNMPSTSFEGMKVAFIQAHWHFDIVEQCRISFMDKIAELIGTSTQVDVFDVPGAFEIPLQARYLANTGNYAAIVGAALVVNGGIYRHDFVAQAVISGLMQAQMETNVPILSAVLTPHHFHETSEHRDFFLRHFSVKGEEVANACASIIALRERIKISA